MKYRTKARIRRVKFWWAYIFGGNFDHPERSNGWMPSIFRRTITWKLYTFKGESTWWEWCRPPRKI